MRTNTWILAGALALSLSAEAEPLRSPFPSSLPGIQIPNSHAVASPNGNIFRGMEPQTTRDLADIHKLGITRILTFKYDRTSTVADLHFNLRAKGLEAHHVPIDWKNFKVFADPCMHFVDALKILRDAALNPREKLYFHCTVGEDRTGALAALFRLLYNPRADLETVFKNEMCDNGYEAGNGLKDFEKVVAPIRDPKVGLTQVFLKMAYKIQTGEIRWDNLQLQSCVTDPGLLPAYRELEKEQLERFQCTKSSKVPW